MRNFLTLLSIAIFMFACSGASNQTGKSENLANLKSSQLSGSLQIQEQESKELISETKNLTNNEMLKEPTEDFLTFTDDRDGETYKIVKIGNQFWLAENFRYKPKDGKYGGFDGNYWAYDDNQSNVAKYGYLYDYETALKIAPEGWHLPTKEEFESLINTCGNKAFDVLTKENGGLNVVYGGWFYEESMAFAHEGNETGFWSASDKDKDNAWICIFEREYKHVFMRTRFKRGVGASVRLVRDK